MKAPVKKSMMALDVLWTTCQIVAFRTNSREKFYHVPEKFFAEQEVMKSSEEEADFETWILLERVEASGLLASNNAALWSSIRHLQKSDTLKKLIQNGNE